MSYLKEHWKLITCYILVFIVFYFIGGLIAWILNNKDLESKGCTTLTWQEAFVKPWFIFSSLFFSLISILIVYTISSSVTWVKSKRNPSPEGGPKHNPIEPEEHEEHVEQ